MYKTHVSGAPVKNERHYFMIPQGLGVIINCFGVSWLLGRKANANFKLLLVLFDYVFARPVSNIWWRVLNIRRRKSLQLAKDYWGMLNTDRHTLFALRLKRIVSAQNAQRHTCVGNPVVFSHEVQTRNTICYLYRYDSFTDWFPKYARYKMLVCANGNNGSHKGISIKCMQKPVQFEWIYVMRFVRTFCCHKAGCWLKQLKEMGLHRKHCCNEFLEYIFSRSLGKSMIRYRWSCGERYAQDFSSTWCISAASLEFIDEPEYLVEKVAPECNWTQIPCWIFANSQSICT